MDKDARARQMRKKAFRKYAKETNVFFPWFVKSLTEADMELLGEEEKLLEEKLAKR